MQNKLEHLPEFTELLAHHRISDRAKNILPHTQLVLLVAPTSTGRNTVIKELLKTGNYHYLVSDTTRHPRVNNGVLEQNGREYWFRSEDEVLQELKNGEFLEAAIVHNQQVSGISMRELEQSHAEGKCAITDIEVVGAETIHHLKPDTIIIFMLPPSFEEWIRRLHMRGVLPAEEVRRRLESAHHELADALTKDYYFFVVNETVAKTVQEIEHIVSHPEPNQVRGDKGREVARQLYKALTEELATEETT